MPHPRPDREGSHVDRWAASRSDRSGQSDLRARSAGVKDPKAIGFRRISINDLDGRPSPLPHGLAAHCRRHPTLEALGRAVLADAADPSPRDDIALLLVSTRALAPDAIATWEFPAEPTAVARARDAATRQLTSWGLDEAAFATELIVSELVTNAIRYAGGPIGLRLIHDEVLVCEVTDPSNSQPRLRRAHTTDEGGRGLFLVAQLAQRWGSRYGQSGKTIWAEQRLAGRA
ncbi:ATP-binding protein [Streptomyces sp. 205]|uniref:ATP-binding protein n=1 Tax=Streptomyces coffeae TaxID=621382 RepID=A0ABS1NEI9_9ACTN|nr:ATP-binding protein [Streptomyces coffeae]